MRLFSVVNFQMQVSSSIGRAAVSKTAGRRFEPCLTCHLLCLILTTFCQDSEFEMKNPITAISSLYNETMSEMRKCTWPSRNELYESTILVISSLIILSVSVLLADKMSQVFLFAYNKVQSLMRISYYYPLLLPFPVVST